MDGIDRVDDPRHADYLLAGRFDGSRIEYAWIRPLVANADRLDSGMPQRTAWTADAMQLRRDLATLQRIHAWYSLASPPDSAAPYRLAVCREKTRELVRDDTVTGNEIYSIVLRTSQPVAAKRHYYVFVIDRHGDSYLVFPRGGSVENRFPIADPAPRELPLGEASRFQIKPPYGIDTYFLLSTEEPLPDPSILEWDGVRAVRTLTASRWSIERVTFESVAPGRRR